MVGHLTLMVDISTKGFKGGVIYSHYKVAVIYLIFLSRWYIDTCTYSIDAYNSMYHIYGFPIL